MKRRHTIVTVGDFSPPLEFRPTKTAFRHMTEEHRFYVDALKDNYERQLGELRKKLKVSEARVGTLCRALTAIGATVGAAGVGVKFDGEAAQ